MKKAPGLASVVVAGFALLLGACSEMAPRQPQTMEFKPDQRLAGLAVATFAGGCFWCVESGFEKVPGVREAVSGYTGGTLVGPSYREVAAGGTGHVEAVQVYYNPETITFEGLLEAYWRMTNPTDSGGQFTDRGDEYRPVIFYHNEDQKTAAKKARNALDRARRYMRPLTVEIKPAAVFYAAEEYHQDYYKKNPIRYHLYTHNSGRYQFVESVWKDDVEINWMRYRPGAPAQ